MGWKAEGQLLGKKGGKLPLERSAKFHVFDFGAIRPYRLLRIYMGLDSVANLPENLGFFLKRFLALGGRQYRGAETTAIGSVAEWQLSGAGCGIAFWGWLTRTTRAADHRVHRTSHLPLG